MAKLVRTTLSIGLLVLAGTILFRELHGLHYHDILAEIVALPGWRIGLAVLLTICSYLTLTFYDVLGLRYIQHHLEYRKVGLASFISYAFSNTIGVSLLTSGTIRYRMYSAWGMDIAEIGKIMVFATTTFWLGIFTVGSVVFTTEPQLATLTPIPFSISIRMLGVLFGIIVCAYLLLAYTIKKPIRIWKIELSPPPPALALKQVLVGACDWLLAGSVLVVLISENSGFSFGQMLATYLFAQIIGLVSLVPGGLGVFESMILVSFRNMPPGSILGCLLIFRVIYYIFPLVAAGIMAGLFELSDHIDKLGKAFQYMQRSMIVLLPHLLSALVFIAGAILLFSGATPAVASRLNWLERLLPLPVIELSHFLGSLVGSCLLLLARGLQKRLDGAYLLSVVLLGLGCVFSLLKGADYEEALLLFFLLVSMLPCRRNFHRKSSLLSISFTFEWIGSIAVVLLASVGLTLFATKHVAYSYDLWWQFAVKGDEPRSLRALVGVAVFLLLFSLQRLLRTLPPDLDKPGTETLAKAKAITANARETYCNLALLGDKQLLMNDAASAMIMYAVEGRSWVALGDPIGPENEREELVWLFRDRCEQHNGWPIFYEVGTRNLHLYLDIGLNLLKLGEEARVFLPQFSLEGKKRSGLRYTHRRLNKDGYEFSIAPAENVPTIMSDLQRVSDVWLKEKRTREKGFSLGFFQPEYLAINPVALVKKNDSIIAFANIWTGFEKEEFSIDLMRYDPQESRSIMEYLFICLMLWGRDNGYKWFNLGMAPLSGLENRSGAPLWNRLGALAFRHSENFYNFQGLREYKEKFDPVWEPRYLASAGGLALPVILTNIAALISGGVKGVFRK